MTPSNRPYRCWSLLSAPGCGDRTTTAICADLGARTICEEIDALEVLGIDPIHRLVVPRVAAATIVATLLNGAVITIGLVGGFVFRVFIQHVSTGAYVSTLTLVSQRDAGAVRAGAVCCQRGVDNDRYPVRDRNAEMSHGSTTVVLRARFPRTPAGVNRYGGGAGHALEQTGRFSQFTRRGVGCALRHYRAETVWPVRRQSSTARPIPVLRSRAGPLTLTCWLPRPRSRTRRCAAF